MATRGRRGIEHGVVADVAVELFEDHFAKSSQQLAIQTLIVIALWRLGSIVDI
jgi:hypothetical protein